MLTKADIRVRAIDFHTLEQMCADASGMAHSFRLWANKAGTVATLEYSNPDEWGSPRPYRARFPMAKLGFGDARLVFLHCVGDSLPGGDEYDKEACFQAVESVWAERA